MISSEDIWRAVRPRLMPWLGRTDNLELIKQLTGCELATIGNWLARSIPLAGQLIKLWYLMEAVGYPSPEMQRISALQQYVGRLYTFGILDIEEIRELLGVEKAQTAIQFLRGQDSMRLTDSRLEGLIVQYNERLEEAWRAVPKDVIAAAPGVDPEPTVEPITSQPGEMAREIRFDLSDPVRTLAVVVSMAHPLARELVTEGTVEDRRRFRRLVGHPESPLMFAHANVMNQLCSEAARDAK